MSLTALQSQLISSLLVERTDAAACVAVGCTTRALQNWYKQPEFVEELRKARSRVFDGVINSVIGASTSAMAVVHQVLDNVMVPNVDKIEWVKLALSMAQDAVLRDSLLSRLSALEALQSGSNIQWEPTTIEGSAPLKRLS